MFKKTGKYFSRPCDGDNVGFIFEIGLERVLVFGMRKI
jgi:hypothetical protein